MRRLEGRSALITGAASGIGAACALRFAEEGAQVAGFDVNKPADSVWDPVRAVGPKTLFLNGDVRDEENVAAAVATVVQGFGSLDILVNSAGIAGGGPVHAVDSLDWDRVMDVNLKGTFLFCKHAIAQMLEQGRGSVVNIASVEGLEGSQGGSSYNASKGGVVLLTRNIAMDYGRRGIRANCVCPGFIDTPMFRSVVGGDFFPDTYRERIRKQHKLGRFGKPEEVASAVLFLGSDDASFVSGVALPVDGGFTSGHSVGLVALMGLAGG